MTEANEPPAANEATPEWPACALCGSDRVVRDAWASWSRETQEWEFHNVFDDVFCEACERTTTIEWRSQEESREEKIRRLNDALRSGRSGNGTTVATAGVREAGPEFLAEAAQAVAAFDAFSGDNDPHGEHDFGALDVRGERVFFKVDYFDLNMSAHSPDKADPAVTRRVLTIMLASEY